VDSFFRVAALATDLAFAGAATMLTGGLHSPFLLLWVFVIASAAYRWSLRETILTAAYCAFLLLIEVVVSRLWPHFSGGPASQAFDFERLLIRSLFLFAIGLLLGFLAEREKGSIAENNVFSHWIGRVDMKAGMDEAVEAFFDEIVPLYLPLKICVALRKGTMEEVFSWEKGSPPNDSEAIKVIHRVRFSVLEAVGLSFPANVWLFERNQSRPGRWRLLALDDEGQEVRDVRAADLKSCLASCGITTLMVSSLSLGDNWSARLILVDPSLGYDRRYALHVLQGLTKKVSPALESICGLRDIRTQVEDKVRSVLTHELHDRTVQSLLSAEMHIEILKRQALKPTSEIHRRLTAVQSLIHEEVVNLRDLIEKTKPLYFTPNQLPDFLAELVEKFRRETGISTRLVFNEDEITLPPEVCHQVIRIVHEGLSNIRKHSGARNALVSFAKGDQSQQMLLISDDGRGFGFRGRVTHSELESSHRGPGIIKERVRSIGGTLTIDSSTDRGTRLEIVIPNASHV